MAIRDQRRYRMSNATYGSSAYDLDYLEQSLPMQQPLERPEIYRRPREDARTRTRTRAVPREQQSVSLLALAGFAAVAVVLVALLLSFVQLHTVSTQVVEMQNELTALQEEHTFLTAQYEATFDLATVEAAAAQAGMVKPQQEQIYYLDLSGPDKVTLMSESANPGVWERISGGVAALVEYFR